MRKYDLYKDSGVEWVDYVPQHWNLTPFDKVLDEVKLKYGQSDNHFNLLSLSGENGIYFKGYEDEIQIRSKEELENYNVVKEGQIVLNPLVNPLKLDYFGFSVSGIQGVVSPVYMVFETSNTPKYLEWYFKSHLTIQYLLSNTKGVRPLSLQLSRDSLKGIKVIIPPLSEQQQIVSFLDTKTSLIDSLIEKTQRKIELLNEKRTSLINEVVTKGLNTNVEMKDSGVEWIGEIPSGWKKCKIKHLSKTISKGTTPSTIGREILDEGPIYYIKIDDFDDYSVSTPNKFIDETTQKLLERSSLQENDILVVITGSTTGKTVILPKKCIPSNTNQNISFVRLKENKKVKFTWYWLFSEMIQTQVSQMFNVSTLPSLSMEDLGNFQIPQPPLSEQQEIVSYLDEHTQLIDKTISVEERRI